MLFTSFIAWLCMGVSLWTTVSGDTCWSCDPAPMNCFTCLSREDNGDNTDTVTLDFSGCKGSDISWACCVSSSGGAGDGSCVVAEDGCVSQANSTSDSGNDHNGATSVLINTHDGQTYNGDPLTDVDTGVCGGNANDGGGCTDQGGTAYCVNTIDLSSCPSSTPTCPDGECSKTAYLCGPTTIASFACNNGDKAIDTVVKLLYPDCIGNGSVELAANCPNNRGLINYGVGECTDANGAQFWTCKEKVDVAEGSTATVHLDIDEDQCLVDFRLVPINRRLGESGLG